MKIKIMMIITAILVILFLLAGCADSKQFTKNDLDNARAEGREEGYQAGVEACTNYLGKVYSRDNLYEILYEKGAFIDNASLHIVWDNDGNVSKDFDTLVDIVYDLFDGALEDVPEREENN